MGSLMWRLGAGLEEKVVTSFDHGKGLIWMIPGYGDDDYKGRLLTKVEEEKDALVFEDK